MLGFTLNNLTLFGLVLAIGIVVDDAIVVLENIERLIATGLDARTATIKAMDEITGPIIAITLVLCSVFLPSCFIPGITGQFYRQFALTIAAAMIISAINAMTLTPSRAVSIFKTEEEGAARRHTEHAKRRRGAAVVDFRPRRRAAHRLAGAALPGRPPGPAGGPAEEASMLPAMVVLGCHVHSRPAGRRRGRLVHHPPGERGAGLVLRGFNRVFDGVTAAYGWTVGKMLRVSVIVLLVYGGLLALTWWPVATAPTGFIPTQDQGYLLVNVQLPDSASVQRTDAVMAQIERIARNDPRRRPHRRRRRPILSAQHQRLEPRLDVRRS